MLEPIELYRSPRYEDNIDRYGDHSNTCVCCGKPIAEPKLHVHMSTGWMVKHTADLDESDSQGFFPVGPDCAKRIHSDYLHR
jgi:hypothetical protein